MSNLATVRLLVWNAPDVSESLRRVVVDDAAPLPEADLDALAEWLANRCSADEDPSAIVFTTITPGDEAAQRDAITAIRQQGFGVFVKGQRGTDGPIRLSGALIEQLEAAGAAGELVEAIVADHDGSLTARLEAIAGAGVTVTVLGFREEAGFAAASDALSFVDLEDVEGLFPPLARTNLYDLPEEGLTLPPLRSPRNRLKPTAIRVTPTSAAPASVPAAPAADEATGTDADDAGATGTAVGTEAVDDHAAPEADRAPDAEEATEVTSAGIPDATTDDGDDESAVADTGADESEPPPPPPPLAPLSSGLASRGLTDAGPAPDEPPARPAATSPIPSWAGGGVAASPPPVHTPDGPALDQASWSAEPVEFDPPALGSAVPPPPPPVATPPSNAGLLHPRDDDDAPSRDALSWTLDPNRPGRVAPPNGR